MTAPAAITEQFVSDIQGKLKGTFEIIPGRRFDKIAKNHSYSRHVYAFVERATGDLYKAAGWKAPAKGVRFQLGTDSGYAKAVDAADNHGGFLYAR